MGSQTYQHDEGEDKVQDIQEASDGGNQGNGTGEGNQRKEDAV